MAKTNTHGHKITGLRKIAGDSKQLKGIYDGAYFELFYDKKNGKAWTVYQYSLGQNSWTVYHDPNIVKICNLSGPHTMQEIADMIATELVTRRYENV